VENMVEVTIEITQFCEVKPLCIYCSTNASTEGKHLPFKVIKQFLDSIKNITRLNISGGEPLAHPEFYKILKYCETKTTNVWIYTNAIKQIIFNSDIIKELQVEANVCIVPGKEVYIPKNVNRVHLLKLIHQGKAKGLPKTKITVSGNFCDKCSECDHILLQTDGMVVSSPCKKKYCDKNYNS